MAISGATKITGIIGSPVKHTLSPLMHNAAFNHLKLNFVYVPFLVKPSELGDAIRGFKALNVRGINVTVPHKERVVKYMDKLDPLAENVGAVNTVVFENGNACGYNTDGTGFIKSIKSATSLHGKTVLVIGAGGAGSSVSFALSRENVRKLFIYDILGKKASVLAGKINSKKGLARAETTSSPERVATETDIVVNASTSGMNKKDRCVLDPSLLRKGMFIYDIVYNAKTQLLRQAERLGAGHMDGMEMLLFQGAAAFELWTDRKAPLDIMRKVITERR